MNASDKTFAMLLTPPGAGAIGCVRVVGPMAYEIVRCAFKPHHADRMPKQGSNRLSYGDFLECEEAIDNVIVSDASDEHCSMIDISAHGGVRVMERILMTLLRRGADILSGPEVLPSVWSCKNALDENIINALVHAKTDRAVRFLNTQLRLLGPALQDVMELCLHDLGAAHSAIQSLLRHADAACRLIKGAKVDIVGSPNSGKSTLYNRLVGREAVIVSPQAGTTRDWVSAEISLDGYSITLTDTAGRHASPGELELEAIRAGEVHSRQADLLILLLDGSDPKTDHLSVELKENPMDARILVVFNKSDRSDPEENVPETSPSAHGRPLSISALKGIGLERLVSSILDNLGYSSLSEGTPCAFSADLILGLGTALKMLKTDRNQAPAFLGKLLTMEGSR